MKINPDGTVTVVSGAVELGTAAMTGAAQILAEELGVDLTDINATDVDTHLSPYDYGAQGSRTAFSVGNACIAAAKDLRRQIGELVAPLVERRARRRSRLEGKGVVSGNNRLSLAEVAGLSQRTGGGLIPHGTLDPADADLRSHAREEPSAAGLDQPQLPHPRRRPVGRRRSPARSRSIAMSSRRMSASRSTRPTSRARSRAAWPRASARR